MILWPIFIGMIFGFVVLELTMRFRAQRKSFAVVTIPGVALAILGVACILYGALNYTYVGKSLLFLGVAFGVFALMAFATSRTLRHA